MAYLIYKRTRKGYGDFDYSFIGVCSKKNLQKVSSRLKSEHEETPRLVDLRRQKSDAEKKIIRLRESKIRINKEKYDRSITTEIRKMETLANKNIEKEIASVQSRISKLEKEIDDEAHNGFSYIFEQIDILRE